MLLLKNLNRYWYKDKK